MATSNTQSQVPEGQRVATWKTADGHNTYAKKCVKRPKDKAFFSDAHCSVCEKEPSDGT